LARDRVWSADYPWAPTPEARQKSFEHVEQLWRSGLDWSDLAPSLDATGLAEIGRYYRRCASPGAALALMRMNTYVDVREILSSIRVPAVVMHRTDDRDANVEEGRYIASRISGARFVEFAGADHSWWTQDRHAILDEVEELITGVRPPPQADRVLATVLFTDIVRSTERLAELGDHGWAELLARHHATVRREIERFRGREIAPPATASLPRSTALRGRFAARVQSGKRSRTSGSLFGQGSTPASASSWATRPSGSRCIRARVLPAPPNLGRFWSRPPSGTSSPARGLSSRIAASTS
jgi:hypothetical protein